MITQELNSNNRWKSFSSLSGEEIIFVLRKHWISLFYNFLILFLLTLFFIFLAFLIFFKILVSIPLLIASLGIICVMAAVGCIHTASDWYFHVYILTTRRLFEVYFSPLSTTLDNEILLDQVKCTEVDTRVNGFIDELLQVGDVILTFDRPTHQQEFVLSSIEGPHHIAEILNKSLLQIHTIESGHEQKIWIKPQDRKAKFIFIDEIKRGRE